MELCLSCTNPVKYASVIQTIIGSDNGILSVQCQAMTSMLMYWKLNHWEHILLKFESKYNNIYSRQWIWKCCQQSGDHFVLVSMCLYYDYPTAWIKEYNMPTLQYHCGSCFLVFCFCMVIISLPTSSMVTSSTIMTSSNGNYLYYWPFVSRIHQSPVDSPNKGLVTLTFEVPFVISLNKWFNKHSIDW